MKGLAIFPFEPRKSQGRRSHLWEWMVLARPERRASLLRLRLSRRFRDHCTHWPQSNIGSWVGDRKSWRSVTRQIGLLRKSKSPTAREIVVRSGHSIRLLRNPVLGSMRVRQLGVLRLRTWRRRERHLHHHHSRLVVYRRSTKCMWTKYAWIGFSIHLSF